MFHGFIPHIMGTRFDILLIHSDIDRLNTLWADIAYELERLDKILNRFDPHSEVS
ncbi:FAD:protein FMN transferase, partial [Bacteroides xylanisolvens]